jgi:hypothetical protein
MAYNREGYAPWSLTRKAGVQSATVNGDIEVPQYVQPVLDTGFVDEKGDWKGTKSSDETFFVSDTALAVANGASVLFPNTANADFIDMTGFTSLFYAIKPTRAGAVAVDAVMGPDSRSFANLTPVNPAVILRFCDNSEGSSGADLEEVFTDAQEILANDVWNIYQIQGRTANQKNLNFNITNNSGGNSDIDFAFLRVV